MSPAIDVGLGLEPLLDGHLIDRLQGGARHRLHRPRREGCAVAFDRPWEGILALHVTILHDPEADCFRMYYRGWGVDASRQANQADQNPPVTCYAESVDGCTWTKPDLGLCPWEGSTANNIILTGPREVTQRFSPMLDERPGIPATQRFKAIGGNARTGLHLWTSADGIHWREQPGTVAEGKGFDSQNTICWSPADGCYVCFFRSFKEVEGQRVRWISRTTSTDLVDWSAPEELDFGDAPAEHLYTNQIRPYYRAPHILVGTPARFLPGRWALTSEQEAAIGLHDDDKYDGLPGALSEAVLVSSRGGRRCDRTFLEALVRPGDDERDWVARSNYPALGIISTGERQMSMFVARHYGQPSAYLERLSLRVDGFASVTAGFEGGELITPTFVFPGDGLSLNISTAAVGSVRVEIQDETGMALQGLALDDGHELIGDDVDRLASWGPGSDLSHLRGRAVRLRLVLKEADVYALRFHQNRR